MIKKSKLTTIERTDRLKDIIPGQQCSDSVLKPPKTKIYFTQIGKADLEGFHKYSKDKRLYEYFEMKVVKNINDTKVYYSKMEKRMLVDKSHHYWFVKLKENNKLIGSASLTSIDFERKSIEWGQAIDPNYWGQNYNLEIHELLKHYIFDVLNLNRLHGKTMITNKRSIAGIKASGCSFEGILRQYYNQENKFIDAWSYSLLAEEYFDQAPVSSQKNLSVKIEDIVKIINKALDTDEISKESTMSNCWLWDSLAHEIIISEVALKYNAKVKPLDYSQLTSIDLIYEYLKKQ